MVLPPTAFSWARPPKRVTTSSKEGHGTRPAIRHRNTNDDNTMKKTYYIGLDVHSRAKRDGRRDSRSK